MNDRAPSGWAITGVKGPSQGRDFALNGPEIAVGRTPDNDVVLDTGNVSRRHAVLRVKPDGLWLEDLQSKNGTFVNDRRVKSCRLSERDRVRFGDCEFELVQDLPVSFMTDTEITHGPEPERRPFSVRRWAERMGPKKIALYAAALLVLGWAAWTSTRSRPPAPAPAAAKPASEIFRPVVAVPENASEEEVLSWLNRAQSALQYDDAAAAIPLLRKVVAARPSDTQSRTTLERAERRLAALISQYYEAGVREYEKLYFDQAIEEWQKVLSLSDGFDPEMYKKSEEKISEARSKLARMRQ